MKTLTVEDIMNLDPCRAYPEDRVTELFAGRDALSLLEICDLDIPAEDRVWVLTRKGVLPVETLRRFADMTADRAVRESCLTCGVPAVESWARSWLDGTDRTARSADAAAYAAARAAADAAYAAYAAARAAYWAADAANAAYAAYWAADAAYWAADAANAAYAAYAAVYAAYAAVYAAYAAYAAERERHIADLRALIVEVANEKDV